MTEVEIDQSKTAHAAVGAPWVSAVGHFVGVHLAALGVFFIPP